MASNITSTPFTLEPIPEDLPVSTSVRLRYSKTEERTNQAWLQLDESKSAPHKPSGLDLYNKACDLQKENDGGERDLITQLFNQALRKSVGEGDKSLKAKTLNSLAIHLSKGSAEERQQADINWRKARKFCRNPDDLRAEVLYSYIAHHEKEAAENPALAKEISTLLEDAEHCDIKDGALQAMREHFRTAFSSKQVEDERKVPAAPPPIVDRDKVIRSLRAELIKASDHDQKGEILKSLAAALVAPELQQHPESVNAWKKARRDYSKKDEDRASVFFSEAYRMYKDKQHLAKNLDKIFFCLNEVIQCEFNNPSTRLYTFHGLAETLRDRNKGDDLKNCVAFYEYALSLPASVCDVSWKIQMCEELKDVLIKLKSTLKYNEYI